LLRGFALIALTLVSGCPKDLKAPSIREIDQAFPLSDRIQAQVPASQNLDIYVDDSGSMRGFVATSRSNYREVLRNILLSATTAQLHTSVYPLSSDQSINSMPLSEIESSAFYGRSDTPLAAVLRKIASRRDHSAILVSDMVLSERGVDNQGLIAALTDLAVQRPEMRLLAFRSDFAGEYFPEAHTGGKPKIAVNVSQSVPSAGRPFYLLVIAPDLPSMTKLADYLLDRLPTLNTFNPVQPPFEIAGVKLIKSTGGPPQWATYSNFLLRNRTQRRFETGYSLNNPVPPGDSVDLGLTLTLAPKIPMRGAAAFELVGERAVWTGQFNSRTSVTIPVSGALSSDQTSMRAVVTLHKPDPGTWDVYRLRIRSGDGNLDVPQWVHDWSTSDDSSVGEVNRTFQLDTLVGTMENVISEREVCGEWLLKVKGGNN
jgi:hypothetical protein